MQKNPPIFTSRFTRPDSNKVIQGTSVITRDILLGRVRITLYDSAMFYDAFKPLDEKEAQDLVALSAPLLDGAPFGASQPRVLARALPFYPGYSLIEMVSSDSHPPVIRAMIRKNGTSELTILNWTNEPIYHLNGRVPIALSRDHVLVYVRFFFTYIKGTQGRFLIIDNPDEIDWKDEPPPAGRKALAKMIEPLSLLRVDADGTYQLQASMVFKDSLFAAKVAVSPNGQVTLYDEELLVEDIPVRDDITGL